MNMKKGDIVIYNGIIKITSIMEEDMFDYLEIHKQYEILGVERIHDGIHYLIKHKMDYFLWYPEERFSNLDKKEYFAMVYNLI